MRVAFVGKGGAGKSTIAGTFARALAQTGERVLALDSDPMPGLAYSLGIEHSDHGLPDDAVKQYDFAGRGKYRLRDGLSGTDAVERYSARGRDGVRFLQLGKARGTRHDDRLQHAGYQCVLEDLPGAGWSIVGDLPGGTRQPFFTWGRFADTYIVVTEASPASMLTGRRLARLAEMKQAPRVLVLANKVREPADAGRVAAGTGLELLGSVPFDPAVASADRSGQAVIDVDPDGPTVSAVRLLVAMMLEETERQ